MDQAAITKALDELDERTEPAALRFDDGAPFTGELTVLPSAFNPPTHAHAHLLERAKTLSGDGRPLALLTTRNVDKGIHGASLAQRVEMLLALRGDWPELAVVASNQARIIDQARALRTSFEKEPDALTLRFVVGFDTLERLFAARYYTDMDTELAPFFEISRVIASNRADVSTADVQAWIHKHAGPYEACIDVVEIDEFPASLSSSQARDAFAANATTVSVPAVVGEYIRRHGLYSQRP